MTTSRLQGFHKLSVMERRQVVMAHTDLTEAQSLSLGANGGLSDEQADKMVENALGVLAIPFGLCVNLHINGRDRLVPMSIEEPSVVAAASHAAKLFRAGGGVQVETEPSLMLGQVQLLDVPDVAAARTSITAASERLLALADACDPVLVSLGGGARALEVRVLEPRGEGDPLGTMVVVHLVVDVQDAMGANAVNTMCERLAPELAALSGGRSRLRILSNLADRRLVRARVSIPFDALARGQHSGREVAAGIEEASVFAERDPYRAATHNKGIMNGVDAVLIAFGQDWRAVEAGAHAYACKDGHYGALATWRMTEQGLHGLLVMPMAVGTVGGVVRVHPTVAAARTIAGVESAADLGSLVAAVGLAQNFGALRALSAEGIQQGHMRLHARNVAVQAGAVGAEIDPLAEALAKAGRVQLEVARELLALARSEDKG